MDVHKYTGKFTGKEAGYFLLTLAAALALWLYIAASNRKETVANISAGLTTINNFKNSEIRDWRLRRISEALRLNEHPFLGEVVSEEISKPGSRRGQLLVWLKGHTAHKMYSGMAFLSPKGTVIVASPGYHTAADKYFKDAFARSIRERTVLLTDLHLSAEGRPCIEMISPISAGGRGEKPICLLVINIDPEAEFYPLVKAAPLLYAKAETLLVRKEGENLLFLNELNYRSGSAMKLRHPLSDAGLPAAAALKGHTGFFAGIDYRGVKVFSAVSHIEDSGWAVVTKIDRDEVLAPVKARERLQLPLLLAVACLIYIAIYYVLRARRQASEESLAESEGRFKALFEKAPFPAIVHAEDGEVLRVNLAWEQMTGYKHSEIPTIAAWTEKAYGAKRSLVAKDIEKLYGLTDRKAGGEYTIRTKDGSEKVWDFSSAPLGKLPDGRRIVISMTNDLTPRKLAEKKLRESQRVFSEFLEHSPIYVFFKDKDLKSLHLSRNYEKMLGRPMEELLGKSMDDLFPSDLARGMIENDKRIIKDGKEMLVDEELNGRYYHTIKFPILTEDNPPYLAGYTIDVTEQKQAEKLLLAEKERAQSYLELVGVIIIGLDLDQSISLVNRKCCEMLGYTREQLIGKNWFDLVIPAEQREMVKEVFNKIVNGNLPPVERFENDVVTHGGERRTIAWTNRMWRDAEGNTIGLLTSGEDITEQKRATEALLEREQSMKEAQRLAKIGSWKLDLLKNKLSWSDEIYRIFEIDREKFAASYESFLDAIHPEDRDAVNKAYTDSVKNHTKYDIVHRLLMKDGRVKHVNEFCETFYAPDGRPLTSVGTVQDITERKRAEAVLEKYANELQEAHTVANMGSYSFDLKADKWVSSAQLDRIFGLESGEYKKDLKLWTEIVHPGDRAGMVKYFTEYVAGAKHNFDRQYRILRPNDKAERWVHGYGKLKIDEAGNVAEMYGLIQDITEAKLAELQLDRLNRNLAARKQEMENFLYITTHDLRSPLVNIQGFAQNLVRYIQELQDGLAPEKLPQAVNETVSSLAGGKIPEALKYVLESSRKMDSLISSLLKVARLGRVEMKPEILDMNDLVKKATDSIRFQGDKAEVSIKTGVLPPCKADQTAVSQIFANLLGNAIKYRSSARTLEISVTGEVRGARAFYTVADNGSGITARDLPRIWDLFFRGGNPGMEGEGIGLTVVKYMVEKNGGSIKVESKERQGSVFCLELPAAGGQNE